MRRANLERPVGATFLDAAYAAVNYFSAASCAICAFLAAYAAVNIVSDDMFKQLRFLAAYAAVNTLVATY
jgi:hypothetical protein